MSLLLNEPDFYYTSMLNEETLNSSIINLNGVSGVLKGVNDHIQGSSTTDDLPEGKTNLYFTNGRAQGAFTAGTGIVIATGTISNTGVLSLTGTTNRISVSGSTGNITLNLPQDINTTSSPQFTGLTLGALSGVLKATAGVVANGATTDDLTEGKTNLYFTDARARGAFSAGTGVSITSGLIAIGQAVGTTSSPQFAGLTLGTLSGVLKATAGVIANGATTDDLTEGKTNLYFTDARARGAFTAGTGIGIASGVITNTAPATITSITGTSNQIIVSGTSAITLSTPQDIGTSSSPQFARILNSSIGSTNLLLGTSTGANLTTGGGNTLIGQGSGNAITTGTFNIGLGTNTYGGSGTMTQNSAQNIAIGNSALFSATTTANNNVACGYQALQTLTDGNNNTAVGVQAGQAVIGGIRNTLIGNSAGYSVSSGSYNTLVGASPSFVLTTGSFNTSLGYLAGQSLITGSNNLHLGYNTQASSSSVNNEIVIGNSSTITQGKGTNTAFINASAGLYTYIPYAYNLWNNNTNVVSQVEQWIVNTAGGTNTGTSPTITSGVLTNLPIGLLKFDISGFIYVVSQTCYPTLQYKASGGSFVTVAMGGVAFSAASFVPVAISANIRIDSSADAIRLFYPNTAVYGNVGTNPSFYSPAGNYGPRYMTINFISL